MMMDETTWSRTRSSKDMCSGTLILPPKIGNVMHSAPNLSSPSSSSLNYNESMPGRNNSFSGYDPNRVSSCEGSPMKMSPWMTHNNSHFTKSQWSNNVNQNNNNNVAMNNLPGNGVIIGSIVREEGHIYSLAAKSELLYTGSDSKNIRVWKNMEEFCAFKSNSGLVKSIIISGDRIFTGHQDGKVRVWKVSPNNPSVHKRTTTLPTFIDIFKASIRPKNYVEVKRNKTALWMKHCDAISSLSICEEDGLLYSASWDRTIKVWRIHNSKCVESINAHDDAVNSVVSSVGCIVYSGSADGSVKIWKRERNGKSIRHVFVQNLIKEENAMTALAVNKSGSIVYSGSSDGLVNFWERDNKYSHGGTLKGHKLAVLCLSASGNLVFSGSADKNICVWRRDGTVHICLTVLTGHTGPVKCLEVEEKDSGEGNQRFVVYSGSLDKSVKVWSVSEKVPELPNMEIFQQDQNTLWDTVPQPKYESL